MKNFIIQNWLYIAIILVAAVYIVYLVATKNWPGLRLLAYKAMLRAEKVYREKGGEAKFNLVLAKIYAKYPLIDLLMDEVTLKQKLQDWFDIAKDELDDGMINDSVEKHPPGPPATV